MPTDLLESTLFGHVKGAFTSAIASKKGLFEMADRGTLFLDEIGTMGLETQAKILRVLQDRKFMHLGGVSEIQVDVRIIAATNVDLRQQVKDGKFREDLFYRLNVITIDSAAAAPAQERHSAAGPPLRSEVRRGKRKAAVATYARGHASAAGLRLAGQRARTGERDRARGCAGQWTRPTVDLLPDNMVGRGSKLAMMEHRPDASLFEIMEDCERRIISDMLEKSGWNQTEAADRFRIPLSTLNQKIKRLNIEIGSYLQKSLRPSKRALRESPSESYFRRETVKHFGSLARALSLRFMVCSMLAASSFANPLKMEITIGEPMQTIMDNGPGDTNPAASTIGFSVNGAGWTAMGTVIEKIVPGTSASLTFTKVTVARVAGGPAGAVLVPFDIFTDVFTPPIPPVSMASATLAGSFVDAGVQGNVNVNMDANACMPIDGNLSASPPPLAFNKTTGVVAIHLRYQPTRNHRGVHGYGRG